MQEHQVDIICAFAVSELDDVTQEVRSVPNPKFFSELSMAARVLSKPCSPLSTFDATCDSASVHPYSQEATRILTDEDLIAWDAALSKGFSDLGLVPVHTCRVDMPMGRLASEDRFQHRCSVHTCSRASARQRMPACSHRSGTRPAQAWGARSLNTPRQLRLECEDV